MATPATSRCAHSASASVFSLLKSLADSTSHCEGHPGVAEHQTCAAGGGPSRFTHTSFHDITVFMLARMLIPCACVTAGVHREPLFDVSAAGKAPGDGSQPDSGPSSRVLVTGHGPQRAEPEFLRLLRAGAAEDGDFTAFAKHLRGLQPAAIDRELRAMQVGIAERTSRPKHQAVLTCKSEPFRAALRTGLHGSASDDAVLLRNTRRRLALPAVHAASDAGYQRLTWRAQVLEGEDDVEDSQELRDLCHFFDFIEGEVASSRNFEFTQVCPVRSHLRALCTGLHARIAVMSVQTELVPPPGVCEHLSQQVRLP